jgi:mannosyltransferase
MSATAAPPAVGRAQSEDGRSARPSRERLLTAAAIGIPTALAAALCLYDISTRSLWLDEAATVSIASQHGAALGSALAHDGGNMLGYYALIHVLIGAFGKGAIVLRLPSAIASVATVSLVSLLGLRLFERRVAFGAGLLAAVSLPLVYWGQNARGYSLMVALIAGSFLALVLAVQSERPLAAWIAYGVLMVAAVYAGLEAVLVIPAQLAVLIRYRERWRGLLVAVAAVGVCCVPLAVLALDRGSGQLFWVPAPSFETAKQVVQSLASTGLQPKFYTATGNVLLALTGVVLVLGVWRIWSLARGSGGWAAAWAPLLVLSWLVVPFVLALLESAVGQSIFQARYLLVSLPAVALLLAWTLLDVNGRVPALLGFAAFGVLIALRATQLVPTYGVSPEDWRAATAHVVTGAQAGDCIAFYPLDNRQPFQYYLGAAAARAPRPILPALPLSQARPYVEDYATLSPAQLSALRSSCTRVWLLTSHEGTAGGPPISRQNYTRLNALLASLRREYPVETRRTFGTAHTVALTLFTGGA